MSTALIFTAGLVVGALIMGVFDSYQIYKDDEKRAETITSMQDYIHDLESDKDELLEQNARLRETIIRRDAE